MKERTKLTLENTIDGKSYAYTAEIDTGEMEINNVMDELVKPLLLAAGFHQSTVEDYFDD